MQHRQICNVNVCNKMFALCCDVQTNKYCYFHFNGITIVRNILKFNVRKPLLVIRRNAISSVFFAVISYMSILTFTYSKSQNRHVKKKVT